MKFNYHGITIVGSVNDGDVIDDVVSSLSVSGNTMGESSLELQGTLVLINNY